MQTTPIFSKKLDCRGRFVFYLFNFLWFNKVGEEARMTYFVLSTWYLEVRKCKANLRLLKDFEFNFGHFCIFRRVQKSTRKEV